MRSCAGSGALLARLLGEVRDRPTVTGVVARHCPGMGTDVAQESSARVMPAMDLGTSMPVSVSAFKGKADIPDSLANVR